MSRRRSARRRLAGLTAAARPMSHTNRLAARRARLLAAFGRHPRATTVSIAAVVASLSAIVGGPVAALVLGTYSAIGAATAQARQRRRRDERVLAGAVEAVGTLAAELRAGLPLAAVAEADPSPAAASGVGLPPGDASGAGLPPGDASGAGLPPGDASGAGLPTSAGWGAGLPPGAGSVAAVSPGTAAAASERVAAACQISERLGAPLAELLDRVDTDLRAGQRLRLSVAAQTAGAQATAVLLACLPLAGIALGAGLGANPLHLLLRTPLGAACATVALGLQAAGLAWSSRLVRSVVGEVS